MHAVCVWLFSVFAVPGAVPYASRESNTRVVCTRPEDSLRVACAFLSAVLSLAVQPTHYTRLTSKYFICV